MYDSAVSNRGGKGFLRGSVLWKFALVVLAVAVLYVLAGFFLAPRLLKGEIAAALTTHSGVPASIESVTVNPLTLELQARRVVFANVDALPLLTLEQVSFRLQPLALVTDGELRGRVDAKGKTKGSGRLEASGWLTPLLPAMDARVTLSDTDMTALGPAALPLDKSLRLASGQLTGNGSVLYTSEVATITGDLEMTDVQIVAVSTERPVFKATRIEGGTVAIEPSNGRAAIETLSLETPVLWLERRASDDDDPGKTLLSLIVGPNEGKTEVHVVEVRNGALRLTDSNLPMPVLFNVEAVTGRIEHGSRDAITGSLRGQPQSGGFITTNWKEVGAVTTTLENVVATELSPYALALVGREIIAGRLDARVDYRGNNNEYRVTNELSFTGLELGEAQPLYGEFDLALELAVALLEDERGRLKVSIPFERGPKDANDPPLQPLRTAVTNFVRDLAAAPFTTLAAVVEQEKRDLGMVDFMPGSAALSETAGENLQILAGALVQRPRISVEVNGRYDPVRDRDVLARQQMRLHIALATSAGPTGAVTQAPLNVDDPKVIDILDEFATTRLRAEELAVLQTRFPGTGTDFYTAVFNALVANEPVSQTALKALARYRARSIIDALARAGVDRERLRLGAGTETRDESSETITIDLQIVVASPWAVDTAAGGSAPLRIVAHSDANCVG